MKTNNKDYMTKKILLIVAHCLPVAFFFSASAHPDIVHSDADKPLAKEMFAKFNVTDEEYRQLADRVKPYVERHVTDPQWILSRMAIYWKDGERYTQCYIKNQRWEKGEGNAPVPTLRLPGQRTWNKWKRPSLENLTPYNETGDLTCIDPKEE
ncbi:MAG: hypothetical protein ACI36Z_01860, partial [Alloprevotella sp.]